MNLLLPVFCCVALALTSGHVIPYIPSGSVGVSAEGALVAGPAGSVHTTNGLLGHAAGVQVSGPSGQLDTREGHVLLRGPGHLDNTWGHAEEGQWKDAGAWHGEEHNEDDGLWKSVEHEDWNHEDGNDEEEKKWDAEEEKWDHEEADEHENWNHGVHKLVKRQEGRWNKELERYEITSPRSNDGQLNSAAYTNNDDASSPISLPIWGHHGL